MDILNARERKSIFQNIFSCLFDNKISFFSGKNVLLVELVIFFFISGKKSEIFCQSEQNLVQLCFRHDAERFLFQPETESGDLKNIHQVHIKLVLLEILFPPRN